MTMTRIFTAIALMAVQVPPGMTAGEPTAELQPYVDVLRHAGKEPVTFVLDRFKGQDLLIFDDGLHTAVEPFDFYRQLVRTPAFSRQVKYIFLEVLPINRQPQIDGYLDTEPEDQTFLYPAFQDDYGEGFAYKTYFDLLHAVYDVNRQLPKAERMRVIAVSNPVYWSELKTPEDLALFRKSLAGRDALMYEVIRDELDNFHSGRKGIFLTNTRHAYKGIRDRQGRLYWNTGTYFHERHPGKTYSLRCHEPMLFIEKRREKAAATRATTEGMERMVYRWVRPGRGRWDSAWHALGDQPTAIPLAGSVFGREPYVGNHMLDAAPGQTLADAYDAVVFLSPLERLRKTAMIGEIYTAAFRRELARRYRILYTPGQLAAQTQEAGVRTIEEIIERQHAAAPEQPLPQLRGLEPVDAWRMLQ
jgi:hypothetical protein